MKKIINIVDFINKKEFNELINILPILENHFDKMDPENYEYEDNHLAIKFRLEVIFSLLYLNILIFLLVSFWKNSIDPVSIVCSS